MCNFIFFRNGKEKSMVNFNDVSNYRLNHNMKMQLRKREEAESKPEETPTNNESAPSAPSEGQSKTSSALDFIADYNKALILKPSVKNPEEIKTRKDDMISAASTTESEPPTPPAPPAGKLPEDIFGPIKTPEDESKLELQEFITSSVESSETKEAQKFFESIQSHPETSNIEGHSFVVPDDVISNLRGADGSATLADGTKISYSEKFGFINFEYTDGSSITYEGDSPYRLNGFNGFKPLAPKDFGPNEPITSLITYKDKDGNFKYYTKNKDGKLCELKKDEYHPDTQAQVDAAFKFGTECNKFATDISTFNGYSLQMPPYQFNYDEMGFSETRDDGTKVTGKINDDGSSTLSYSYKDGTNIQYNTDKDGNTTLTFTDKNGIQTKYKRNPDGSLTQIGQPVNTHQTEEQTSSDWTPGHNQHVHAEQ